MEWPGFRHYKGDSDKTEDTTPETPYTVANDLFAVATNKAQEIIEASWKIRALPLPASDRADMRMPTKNGLQHAVGRVNAEMKELWEFLNSSPAEVLPKQDAVKPGTERWDELVRVGTNPTDDWALGDAAAEVFPLDHIGAPGLHNEALDNLTRYASQIGVNPDTVWERRRVSAKWPPGTRVTSTSWAAHKELMHSRGLLKPRMTDAEASVAPYAEVLDRINEANASIIAAIEIVVPGSFNDDERRMMRLFLDDTQRVWVGGLLAAIDGGCEAYNRYVEANQPQKDIYEAEFGPAIPAAPPKPRRGGQVGGDGSVPL